MKKKVVSLEADVPTSLTKPIENVSSPKIQEEPTPEAPKVEEEPYLKNSEEPTQSAMSFEMANENAVDDKKPKESVEDTIAANISDNEEKSWDFSGPAVPTSTWTPEPAAETGEVSSAEEEENLGWEPYMKTEQTSAADVPQPEIPTEAPAPAEADNVAEEPYLKQSQPNTEEQRTRSTDRIGKLKELSMRLRTPSGISDMENEPAYKRRQVQLDDVQHSSESQVSRFSLNDDEGIDGHGKTRLNDNNSFLHDNVD